MRNFVKWIMAAVLGIDYGAKKVGFALAEGKVALPLRVVRYETRRELRDAIRRACEEHDASTVVVGIPRPLRGGKSAQTRAAEEFVAWLRRELSLPVLTEDERLTTAFAKRLMREWKGKAEDDAIAAALILQSYVESRA